MRYEAKHHYFKRLAVTTGNFINLPYTLSKRHQERVSYQLQASNGSLSSFIEKGIEIGKYKVGAVIHIGYNTDEFPLFWKIHSYCVQNS